MHKAQICRRFPASVPAQEQHCSSHRIVTARQPTFFQAATLRTACPVNRARSTPAKPPPPSSNLLEGAETLHSRPRHRLPCAWLALALTLCFFPLAQASGPPARKSTATAKKSPSAAAHHRTVTPPAHLPHSAATTSSRQRYPLRQPPHIQKSSAPSNHLHGRGPDQLVAPAVVTRPNSSTRNKIEATPEAEPFGPPTSPSLSVPEQLAHGGSALQFPVALRRFFGALQQREQEPGNETVRILQWGDSHTAADMFTAEVRARMQARFGDGGVGFTYAGHPFAGYRILGSGRSQSASWTTLGTHFTQLGDALLGLGGVAIESSHTGNTASLDAPCLTLDVHYLRQPNGGTLQFADNGLPVETLSTATETPNTEPSETDPANTPVPAETPPQPASPAAGTFHYDCQAGTHHFTLTSAGGGPVRLLGTVALQPGITWEAMGINGAEAPLLLRWNQPLFHSYLADAAPGLIVLAYGTNEAAAHWSTEEYRAAFTRILDTLHRTVPAASILVLGPGDRALGSTSYTTTGRGRRLRRVAHHVFTPYTGTDRILNVQRDICRTHGCAFWDWRQRQGGLGAMNRWVAAGLAQPDHTHFTGPGYRALADALIADLLSAYSQFQQNSSENNSNATPQ